MTEPIAPGIDVRDLRQRFLAAGGTIYKHRGDDRWVHPKIKSVRVHSDRKDAPRELIRLVRLAEQERFRAARDPQPDLAIEPPRPARPRIPIKPRRTDPVTTNATLSEEGRRLTFRLAEEIASKRALTQQEREGRRRNKGILSAAIRRAKIIAAQYHGKLIFFYGLDIISALKRAYLEQGRAAYDRAFDKLAPEDVIDFGDITPLDGAGVDYMITLTCKLKGRSDLLPTAEWTHRPDGMNDKPLRGVAFVLIDRPHESPDVKILPWDK